MGRRAATVVLEDQDRAVLEGLASRRTTAQALAMRARIVLKAGEGMSATQTASQMQLHLRTVGKWRRRFAKRGLDGLLDEPCPGQRRKITDAHVEAVTVRTLESKPVGSTHWFTRSMAKATGLNQTAVSRIWRAFALQPHRQENFKLSRDPLFIDKVRDIVGLCSNPPDRAPVLCVDERVRFKPWRAPLPCCPCVLVRQSGEPMTTYAMARPAYSLRWIPKPVRSSIRCTAVTARGSFAYFLPPSTPTCLLRWMCIW